MGSVLFLSHGGGPLPLLGDPSHRELAQTFKELGRALPKPKAIVVISAHWETSVFQITSGKQPPLIYDYAGFPPKSYTFKYPANGHPVLAKQISEQLTRSGLSNQLDPIRGFDHGVFVPLMLMYPKADVPVVQISLSATLDPKLHLQLGQALRPLLTSETMVIGSGFSFHNMRAFFSPESKEMRQANLQFDEWLSFCCTSTDLVYSEQQDHMIHWESAPYARDCHPREEHLLPLHVCVGLAQSPAKRQLSVDVLGKRASMFLWELDHA